MTGLNLLLQWILTEKWLFHVARVVRVCRTKLLQQLHALGGLLRLVRRVGLVHRLWFRSHKIGGKQGVELIKASIAGLILLSADALGGLLGSHHLTLHGELLMLVETILSLPLLLL